MAASINTVIHTVMLYALFSTVSPSDLPEPPVLDPIGIFPKTFSMAGRLRAVCSVNKGSLPMSISWTHNGLKIVPDKTNIIISKQDDYSSTLIIHKLDVDHIGNFTCEAINPFGSDRQSTTIYLKVAPSMLTSPSDSDILRHSASYFHCYAKGFPIPKVIWHHSDENEVKTELINGGKRKIFENGTLLINDVQVEDSGRYTCEVDNGVGDKLTASALLKVHEPPVIITNFQTVTSKKGQMTKIKCSAKGETPIIWEWFKAGKHLPVFHGDRLEATEEVRPAYVSSELVIRDTKTEDAAIYECKAKNKFGETSGTAELTVLEPPDAPKEVKINEIGSRFARLSWRAPYSGNSPVIHYKVRYWTNDGKGRRLQEVNIPGEVSCHLKKIHPGTKYHVAVVAENSVGAGNPSNPVDFTTTEEEPSAAPTDVMVLVVDSTSLKVTWKSPPKDTWNGRLTSYQVGFRQHGVELAYRFEMVRMREQKFPELTLSGLQPSTRYDVIVRAINAAGMGPWSPEISAYTSSGNPPTTPILRIISSTSHTLQLEWEVHGLPKPDAVKQFVLEYGRAGKLNEKVHIPGSKRKLLLRGLEGNIRYELRMASYNEHGLSPFSPTVSETTMDFQSEAMTQENEATPFYLRLYFIVPVAVSVTVVVSTLVVAWACVARTRALESASHLLRETPYDYCAKMPLTLPPQQQPPQMPISAGTMRPDHRQPTLEEAYDLPWDMTLNDGNYTRLQNGDGRRTMRAEHNRRSR